MVERQEFFPPQSQEIDKPRHGCGVVGIYHPFEEVARPAFFALYALQHRGQESAGMASCLDGKIEIHKDLGWVAHVFQEENIQRLKGNLVIGHTRYSNTGSNILENSQPLGDRCDLGEVALSYNGNLVNSDYLKKELETEGEGFVTSTDSEVLLRSIARTSGSSWEEKIKNVAPKLIGAYSLVLLTQDRHLIGVRDPFGIRPLCLGRYNQDGFVLASESCALDTIGAGFLRELEPGEILSIDSQGRIQTDFIEQGKSALCIFEFIYYARGGSRLKERFVAVVRHEMGKRLAWEHPVEADFVLAIPDTAIPAAFGFSEASGIPLVPGIEKNRYIGRTFIQPDQRLRDQEVILKLLPILTWIEGKRVVVVDDSIVRGTTTPKVVEMLRRAGAKEVHMRITSPPIKYPCFFGIDTASGRELIAAIKDGDVEEIRKHIGADSLGYLSLKGVVEATRWPLNVFCVGCFTGNYPFPVPQERDKFALKKV
jgi:amidophosphoribosyltransferase